LPQPSGKKTGPAPLRGLVVGIHGRHYRVELEDGTQLHCYPKGKKSNLACGDRIEVTRTAEDQGSVQSVAERTSLLYRSVQHREKTIAANVTQAVVVLAAKPSFYEDLLIRCLVAAEDQQIKTLIVLNKADLTDETAVAMRKLALYEKLGYAVLPLSAKRDVSPLLPRLAGETSVLVGQSGMGKSTIVNALVPGAGAETAEYSQTLDSGKHTTTSATLYHLDADTHIIDSPGMQSFGLHHLSPSRLVEAFRELRPLIGRCRFADCRHAVEPGCAMLEAVKSGAIDRGRWTAYRTLADELAGRRPDWS
jgi:ribosome biogenesis GTPase / thiamine phosphate phosphatase